jgi:hypothetical protein
LKNRFGCQQRSDRWTYNHETSQLRQTTQDPLSDKEHHPLTDSESLVGQIRAIHETIRVVLVGACEDPGRGDLSQVAEDDTGDTIYAVDRISRAGSSMT